MSTPQFITVDANEAVAKIAHATNEVIAIYPITPASSMGEHCDAWSSQGRRNHFGKVPDVVEMQSEAGAAGVVHGALQAGSLCTTFTASQGLLLMIPNMFKIAGELTPTVFHVSARTVATHALSIFGDHSDVMAVRSTGWAMLCSCSVQEAHDFALISQAATLETRVPFLHFFDGFRTSHEVNKIEQLDDNAVGSMINDDAIAAHRRRAMDPDTPVLRGSAQNPDVFFQAREACNPYYEALPALIQGEMDRFAEITGRQYRLCEYQGVADPERVVVLMGSGVGAAEEAVSRLVQAGEKVGLLKLRLFRPFPIEAFCDALPSSTRAVAVLDRTKEPGAIGEPLYQDVVTALAESLTSSGTPQPKVIGGRYGLSSKEFTPAMCESVFAELAKEDPRQHFTVGIRDDVSHLSLAWDATPAIENDQVTRAVFYGLGSDGTVGASKNSVKIIGENTPMYAQGYFVYDSKKAGSVTVSHLRFSPEPIHSTYLIQSANFVGCHQFSFLEKMDVLDVADRGATFLLNTSHSAETAWENLPSKVRQAIVEKDLNFHVVDAYRVASESGLGNRINTVMQTCFFALSNLLPKEQAIEQIKLAIKKTYGKRGESVLKRNYAAVDASLAALRRVEVPASLDDCGDRPAELPEAPSTDFQERVTAVLLAGRGEMLPVSALPVDGTFPTGTAKLEKRSIAAEIPIWDPAICIDCGLCSLVCPHAAIRMKVFPDAVKDSAPSGYACKPWQDKSQPDHQLTIQVMPDDCTGCGVCVDVCPAKSKEVARHKAINMEPKMPHLQRERQNAEYFLEIEHLDRAHLKHGTVKGSQLLEPLFEFSGACAGCGETPYLKLMSQLFGDRVLIGNATGCSSIYGGNLPTTPWTTNSLGRGPAWSNSLFEDNAEFGLGLRLAVDAKRDYARQLLSKLNGTIDKTLVDDICNAAQLTEQQIEDQRARVEQLRNALYGQAAPEARALESIAESLVRRSVWIVGGDGWAFDIGFGGLDHVLTSGKDVNILVLDTGVYSNTGGQASKSTPRAAVAKFASGGKQIHRKDLGMLAVSYGNVYVAQIAMGANPAQTIRTFLEAESYPGPSLILAYSHCIAHGINMTTSMTHQKDAVQSGFWPLYRYDPRLAHDNGHAFHLDSRAPRKKFKEFASQEARFAMLERSDPAEAQRLFELAQRDIDDQWHYYQQMAGIEREVVTGTNQNSTSQPAAS